MADVPAPIWHLAQLNVGYALAPTDSPLLADFMAQLDEINAIADTAPGFVWRLIGDSNNATDLRIDGHPNLLVNMSVWTSPEALFDYVYKTAHAKVMARRREWFSRTEVHQVMWWIPAGYIPTLAEAMAKLDHLRDHGPSPEAFTFKQRYPAPGQLGGPSNMRPEPYCVP